MSNGTLYWHHLSCLNTGEGVWGSAKISNSHYAFFHYNRSARSYAYASEFKSLRRPIHKCKAPPFYFAGSES